MIIASLLGSVRSTNDCSVEDPSALPVVAPAHSLPDDVKEFYTYCGGLKLAHTSEYAIEIVKPAEVVLANPVIVGELYPEDITSSWYIIARDPQNNYLTIDFDRSRWGRCYDSFFDRHGIVGSCPIIASSFTHLLENLWNHRGKYWFWLRDDFHQLGDAYD